MSFRAHDAHARDETAREQPPDRKGDEKSWPANRWFLLPSAVLLVITVGSYWLWPEYRQFIREAWRVLTSGKETEIHQWVAQFGGWGPLVIILLMILQMFLLVAPSWLLMVIAVLAYGGVWGSLLAMAAVAVASALGYGIGHVIGRHGLDRLLGEKKEEKIRAETRRYGIWAVVIARINPFLSNDAISLAGGMLHLGFWKFMLATLGGIAPLAALIGAFGESWTSMKTGLFWLSIASLVGLGIKIAFDKRQDNKRGARKT